MTLTTTITTINNNNNNQQQSTTMNATTMNTTTSSFRRSAATRPEQFLTNNKNINCHCLYCCSCHYCCYCHYCCSCQYCCSCITICSRHLELTSTTLLLRFLLAHTLKSTSRLGMASSLPQTPNLRHAM